MLKLKHLARDLNIDPHKLRQLLRKEYGYAKGARWKWESKDDKSYQATLARMRAILNGNGRKASTLKRSTSATNSSGKDQ